MLAGAVNSRKRLFVEEADESVTGCDLAHDLHCELVVVGGDVRLCVDGSKLVL